MEENTLLHNLNYLNKQHDSIIILIIRQLQYIYK
jgi:hypothetical protein